LIAEIVLVFNVEIRRSKMCIRTLEWGDTLATWDVRDVQVIGIAVVVIVGIVVAVVIVAIDQARSSYSIEISALG
jgi:hypothetical protein